MISIQGFKLEIAYTMRALARALDCGWDHKKLRRVLKAGNVLPRKDGLVWISDIKDNMQHLLDSWAELMQQKELARLRLRGGSVRSDSTDHEDN